MILRQLERFLPIQVPVPALAVCEEIPTDADESSDSSKWYCQLKPPLHGHYGESAIIGRTPLGILIFYNVGAEKRLDIVRRYDGRFGYNRVSPRRT